MRLDQYIKNKKDITRNKAQAIIKSWNVTVSWIKITKTWYEVNDNDIIVITELDETNYVARSAIKLKWLFESNSIDIENKIASARRFFNNATQEYNTYIQMFPTNILAWMFSFKEEKMFETKELERENVKVSF